MGAKVTVKYEYGDMNYEFNEAKDGEAFKKDLEKGYLKNGKNIKIIIEKTKDIKPKIKEKKNYYNENYY